MTPESKTMMQDVHVVVANPAGNITIMVLDEIRQNEKLYIATRLLGYPEWNAEQVGFVVSPVHGGMGRLEMMGGEFCGNATRSYGYYLAAVRGMTEGAVLVELSGTDALLQVDANLREQTAWTQMPVPHKIEQIYLSEIGTVPVIHMDGILHIIMEDIVPLDRMTQQIIEEMNRIYRPPATGVLYVQGQNLHPMVYVKATNTLVAENSCGSGSIAYAYYLARNTVTGICCASIEQPGGMIETEIVKEAGEIKTCRMGGQISMSAIMTVRL